MNRKCFIAVTALTLASCNQSQSLQSTGIAQSTLLTDDQAFVGEPGADAQEIDAEEFAARVGDGSVSLVTRREAGDTTAQAHAQATYDANVAALQGLREDLQLPYLDLLAEVAHVASAGADPFVEPTIIDDNGNPRTLLSLAVRVEQAAYGAQLATDRRSVHSRYATVYAAAPHHVQRRVPAPDDLTEAPLDELAQAIAALDTALATEVGALEKSGSDPTVNDVMELRAGGGRDNSGRCETQELAHRFRWPLSAFVSPVKDQAQRGLCWDFTALGALEHQQRVQTDTELDLSEQFLANKVHKDWAPNGRQQEGYWPEAALRSLINNRQTMPAETFWTYNQSWARTDTTDAAGMHTFTSSCTNYSGSCSDTNHQSDFLCTSMNDRRFCGWENVTFDAAGTAASAPVTLWSRGETFRAASYRTLLTQGFTIMASFNVAIGFQRPDRGFVVDPRAVRPTAEGVEPGYAGGHAVQIVGFIDNERIAAWRDGGGNSYDLPAALPASGGYYIIKNSWGCAGDGGYYYISQEYMEAHFTMLSVVRMDDQRSERWLATNGTKPLRISDSSGTNINVDLRVPTTFSFILPGDGMQIDNVTTEVESSHFADELRIVSLFGTGYVTGTFATEGPRVVTVTAHADGATAQRKYKVNAVNTPPEIIYNGPDTVFAEDWTALSITIKDKNDTNTTTLAQRCATARWHFTAPAWPRTDEGCLIEAAFSSGEATNTFTITARDHEGALTRLVKTVTVRPATESPFPKVQAAGVRKNSIGRMINNLPTCSRSLGLNHGAVLPLNQYATVNSCNNTPIRPFDAWADVDVGGNQAAHYEWKLWAANAGNVIWTQASNTGAIGLPALSYGDGQRDIACGLEVTVTSGQRQRTATVWTGECRFAASVPR